MIHNHSKKHCFRLFLLLLLGGLFLTTGKVYTDDVQQDLAENILRFHILATGDSPEEQAQKLYLRDLLLSAAAEYMTDCNTKEEVMAALTPHLSDLEAVACQALRDTGSDLPVRITLENCYFPTRVYADLVFPCGDYDALRVEIGEAQGHNWWCVMFPRLCFADLTYGYVPEAEKSRLEALLTPEHFAQMKNTGSGLNPEPAPIIIRFRIVDWFTSLFRKS